MIEYKVEYQSNYWIIKEMEGRVLCRTLPFKIYDEQEELIHLIRDELQNSYIKGRDEGYNN